MAGRRSASTCTASLSLRSRGRSAARRAARCPPGTAACPPATTFRSYASPANASKDVHPYPSFATCMHAMHAYMVQTHQIRVAIPVGRAAAARAGAYAGGCASPLRRALRATPRERTAPTALPPHPAPAAPAAPLPDHHPAQRAPHVVDPAPLRRRQPSCRWFLVAGRQPGAHMPATSEVPTHAVRPPPAIRRPRNRLLAQRGRAALCVLRRRSRCAVPSVHRLVRCGDLSPACHELMT